MPNRDNITRPILVVGPGRCGSTWTCNALGQHPDVQDLIENRALEATYHEVFHSYWAKNWNWVCSTEELFDRAVRAARNVLCDLFPADTSHWAMKLIWRGRPWEFIHAVFPDARFVHVSRAAITAIPSMMEFVGAEYDTWTNRLHCEAEYVQANNEALALENSGRPYLRIRQEDMSADPDGVWNEVSRFAGLAAFRPKGIDDEINAARSTTKRVRAGRPPLAWSQLSHPVLEMSRRLGYLPQEVASKSIDPAAVAATTEQVEKLSAKTSAQAARVSQLEAECRKMRLVLTEVRDALKSAPAASLIASDDNLRRANTALQPLVDNANPIEQDQDPKKAAKKPAAALRLIEGRLLDAAGAQAKGAEIGGELTIVVRVRAEEEVTDGSIAYLVKNSEGQAVIGTSTFDEGQPLPQMKAGDVAEVRFTFVNRLRFGDYGVGIAINRVTQANYGDLRTVEYRENYLKFSSLRTPGRPLHYVYHEPARVTAALVR